jgi:hypothetical protein
LLPINWKRCPAFIDNPHFGPMDETISHRLFKLKQRSRESKAALRRFQSFISTRRRDEKRHTRQQQASQEEMRTAQETSHFDGV